MDSREAPVTAAVRDILRCPDIVGDTHGGDRVPPSRLVKALERCALAAAVGGTTAASAPARTASSSDESTKEGSAPATQLAPGIHLLMFHRDEAVRRWAAAHVGVETLPAAELSWLVSTILRVSLTQDVDGEDSPRTPPTPLSAHPSTAWRGVCAIAAYHVDTAVLADATVEPVLLALAERIVVAAGDADAAELGPVLDTLTVLLRRRSHLFWRTGDPILLVRQLSHNRAFLELLEDVASQRDSKQHAAVLGGGGSVASAANTIAAAVAARTIEWEPQHDPAAPRAAAALHWCVPYAESVVAFDVSWRSPVLEEILSLVLEHGGELSRLVVEFIH